MNIAGYLVALYLYFITRLYASLFTEFESIINLSSHAILIMLYINVPCSSLPAVQTKMRIVKDRRCTDNIYSYYGKWQPDSQTETPWRTYMKRRTKARRWQRIRQGNGLDVRRKRGIPATIWNTCSRRLWKRNWHNAVLLCTFTFHVHILNLATEHKSTNFFTKFWHFTKGKQRHRAIVHYKHLSWMM